MEKLSPDIVFVPIGQLTPRVKIFLGIIIDFSKDQWPLSEKMSIVNICKQAASKINRPVAATICLCPDLTEQWR